MMWNTSMRSIPLRTRWLAAVLLMSPALSWAQESPFLTGATALQTNILAWMTPVAIILVMVLGGMAMANRMSRADIRALLGTLVDVVIQFGVEGPVRYIKEIWYGPARATGALLNASDQQ
jgi:type IV secretion system protein VirB2